MSRHFDPTPLSLMEANAFVEAHHRHHQPVVRDKYRVGAVYAGQLVGVVQVGRPKARMLDDGRTVEVVRLCTTGEADVCSYLYARAARIAQEMGYSRIITYILDTEPGTSLRAAGWRLDGYTDGGSWSCPSRPREDKAPTCRKQRWARKLKGEKK